MNRAKFVALLQRANGWKLWTTVIIVTLLVVEAIVAGLDLLLYGHVVWDDMIKGLVATAIVEPTHLLFMVFMLGEFAKAERRAIQLSAEHAKSRLSIAIENTEMIVWEIDFPAVSCASTRPCCICLACRKVRWRLTCPLGWLWSMMPTGRGSSHAIRRCSYLPMAPSITNIAWPIRKVLSAGCTHAARWSVVTSKVNRCPR